MKILQNRAMAEDLVLSLQQARRLAVRSQYLAGPEPAKASTVCGAASVSYSGPVVFGVS